MKSIKFKIIGLSILILLSTLVISCKKEWLEAKTDKSLAVPSTLKDFQAMLDNSSFSISASNEVSADGHYFTEAIWTSYAGIYYRNLYTWTKEIPQNSVEMGWSVYSIILNANIILDGLEKINPITANDKNDYINIKSQAKFQRARLFYELSQIFAPMYDDSSAPLDLGIPLRLSSDITIPSKRSSVKDTYDQIINDLEGIKDLLPENQPFITRPSKMAAHALLSRIYLSMEKYDKALENANKCLQLKNTLIDYSKIPLTQTFIGVNDEVLFFSQEPGSSALTTNYLIDADLFNLYNNDDLRKQVFFRTSQGTLRFRGHYSNSQSKPFTGLAIDEQYLIRAECYARANNIILAMKDLNDLLRTRWAKNSNGTTKYVDQTANDSTDALTKILLERRKQLILRGVRWSDLRRLNKDSRFKITLSRTIGGNTYTLEPNSFKYTLPLPDDVVQLTGMPQNTGW